jgi:Tfp pilus assembly protein PilF
MTRHLARIGAVLLATLLLARGQAADEKYIWIYTVIQEADNLAEKGLSREAATKYNEALNQLNELKKLSPEWNPKVVSYRLSYLTGKLELLGPPKPAPGSKLDVALDSSQPGVTATNAPNLFTNAGPEQIKAMQAEIGRLNDDNALLQAKIKEALSVQPAAADPRQLAKAQEDIRALQKDKDALQVQLNQAQAKLADLAAFEQEKKLVDDIKQRLLRQVQLTEALQQENATLKTQVEDLRSKAPLPKDKANEQLQITRAMLSILQATNIALRSQQIVLEARMVELSKNAVPRTELEAVEKERNELRKQLASQKLEPPKDVTPNNNSSNSSTNSMPTEELERQLQIARARLEAFEAQKIPYTPEELALFKKADKKIEVDVKPPAKKPMELPAGAGPLVGRAERAAERGRFAEAESIYQDILRQDEKNLFILSRLASMQLTLGHLDDADKSVATALSVDPQEPLCLYIKGYLRWQQAKLDEALDALSLAAKLDPEKADTQYVLGRVLIDKGARAQAETAMRKVVQLQPRFPEAHYQLALIYFQQQPPLKELAQWHYRKATNLGHAADPEFEKKLESAPAVTSTSP